MAEEGGGKQEKIVEGLQLPKQAARQLVTKVKEIVLDPILTNDEIKAKEGSYFDEKVIKLIIEEDADVYGKDPDTGEKKLLAKFRKNVIPHDIVRTGWENYYITAAASRNRGAAAGPIQVKSAYWKKRKPTAITGWSARYYQNGKVSKMRVNNNVFSSVLGYFEQTPFMGLPCRLTSYTQKYFKYYKSGIPYIQALNDVFKKLVPDNYALQKKAADEKPMYRIADTCFSSVTVNRNFRTGLHMDAGDFKHGYGNLSVIERGKYHGGYTVFPRYGVAFNLRTADFIAMDVHEWHCNTEITETAAQVKKNKALPDIYKDDPTTGSLGSNKPYTRISFVCYLREKLVGCKESETKKYYSRIEFDPIKGPLKTEGKGKGQGKGKRVTRKIKISHVE